MHENILIPVLQTWSQTDTHTHTHSVTDADVDAAVTVRQTVRKMDGQTQLAGHIKCANKSSGL